MKQPTFIAEHAPGRTFDVMTEVRAFLSSRHLNLCGEQQTKACPGVLLEGSEFRPIWLERLRIAMGS